MGVLFAGASAAPYRNACLHYRKRTNQVERCGLPCIVFVIYLMTNLISGRSRKRCLQLGFAVPFPWPLPCPLRLFWPLPLPCPFPLLWPLPLPLLWPLLWPLPFPLPWPLPCAGLIGVGCRSWAGEGAGDSCGGAVVA